VRTVVPLLGDAPAPAVAPEPPPVTFELPPRAAVPAINSCPPLEPGVVLPVPPEVLEPEAE